MLGAVGVPHQPPHRHADDDLYSAASPIKTIAMSGIVVPIDDLLSPS